MTHEVGIFSTFHAVYDHTGVPSVIEARFIPDSAEVGIIKEVSSWWRRTRSAFVVLLEGGGRGKTSPEPMFDREMKILLSFRHRGTEISEGESLISVLL